MISTLIFDLGGVLIENSSKEMFSHFEKVLGLPYETLYPVVLKHWKLWEKGLMSESELWHLVGTDLGQTLSPGQTLWRDSYTPLYREKKGMFAVLETLKQKGYNTALLSNIEEPIKEFIVSKNYQNLDVFVFSCEVKMSKPDREIYNYTLELLQVHPQHAVFIDDRKENVDAAQEIGMQGIHFVDEQSFIQDLHTLGVSLSN